MRKALCVGINDYPLQGAKLKGCVNDAHAWAALLTGHFDVAPGDVTVLLDRHATKKATLAAIERLLTGARKGDVLTFTNASHGTYVADTDGDEPRYDEAICPWDMKDNLVVDDELRELFANLPAGVRLTVVSDSCFSGTVTREPPIPTPDDRRNRFVRPAMLGMRELSEAQLRTAALGRGERFPQSRMREVLVSGCKDSQTSSDALIDGAYHGAMTYYAIDTIAAANYRITYRDLWDRLVVRLDQAGFDQEPQVEGNGRSLRRRAFT